MYSDLPSSEEAVALPPEFEFEIIHQGHGVMLYAPQAQRYLHLDEASGRVYYYNTQTGARQWEPPSAAELAMTTTAAAVGAAAASRGVGRDAHSAAAARGGARGAEPSASPSISGGASAAKIESVPDSWATAIDAKGRNYFL